MSVGRCWVVLLEVRTRGGLERAAVEAVLAELADRYPSALFAPDRCAVQFLVEDAAGPDAALVEGVAVFGRARRAVGFPHHDLVRAEVKTPAELVAEFDAEEAADAVRVPVDQQALAAAYDATRRLVGATSRHDAVLALTALVRELGGTVVEPRPGDVGTLDHDLSLGGPQPLVAAADPYSVERLLLEEVLPAVVEDAHRVVHLLRASSPDGVIAGVGDLDGR